jgi:hypothetical protein
MPFITQEKTNLKYILIVLGLAVLVAGGIIFYQYWWLPKHETKPPEISIKDETANWQIYRNEEYGFEMKYPVYLSFKEEKDIIEDEIFLGYFFPLDSERCKEELLILTVQKQKFDPENIEGDYGKIEKDKVKIIEVGGVKSYMYSEVNDGCGYNIINIPSRSVLQDSGNEITIKMRFYHCESPNVTLKSIQEKILSTFKFIK